MGRLRRSDCSEPGISSRRRGRGFGYLDADGRRIEEPATLERIRALSLPPAWTDVWICSDPNGHLQAVGTDSAGRRQYRYHDRWRERRDQEKFDEMLAFARALPHLRERAAADLCERGQQRELACAVRLLDRGFFRVGGEEYADQNRSYGIATLERKHVELAGNGVLVFDYPAKSGKRRVQAVVDPEVYKAMVDANPLSADFRSADHFLADYADPFDAPQRYWGAFHPVTIKLPPNVSASAEDDSNEMRPHWVLIVQQPRLE